MSRTLKRAKAVGKEFWSRRPRSGYSVPARGDGGREKRIVLSKERMRAKQDLRHEPDAPEGA